MVGKRVGDGLETPQHPVRRLTIIPRDIVTDCPQVSQCLI
jgi:hypothetical protein